MTGPDKYKQYFILLQFFNTLFYTSPEKKLLFFFLYCIKSPGFPALKSLSRAL